MTLLGSFVALFCLTAASSLRNEVVGVVDSIRGAQIASLRAQYESLRVQSCQLVTVDDKLCIRASKGTATCSGKA